MGFRLMQMLPALPTPLPEQNTKFLDIVFTDTLLHNRHLENGSRGCLQAPSGW